MVLAQSVGLAHQVLHHPALRSVSFGADAASYLEGTRSQSSLSQSSLGWHIDRSACVVYDQLGSADFIKSAPIEKAQPVQIRQAPSLVLGELPFLSSIFFRARAPPSQT